MSEQIQLVVKGENQATPAIAEAKASLKDLVEAGKASAIEVVRLDQAFNKLRTDFNTGRITSVQYAQQLRTMRADLAALANQTSIETAELSQLEKTSRLVRNEMQMAQSINQRFASGLTRTAFGIQALTTSMEAGRVSATGLSAALLTMSSADPKFMAVVAGLAAVASVIGSIVAVSRHATSAVDELLQSLGQSRESVEAAIDLAEHAQQRSHTIAVPYAGAPVMETEYLIHGKWMTEAEFEQYRTKLYTLLGTLEIPDRHRGGTEDRLKPNLRDSLKRELDQMELDWSNAATYFALHRLFPGRDEAEADMRRYREATAPIPGEPRFDPKDMVQLNTDDWDRYTDQVLATANHMAGLTKETLEFNKTLEATQPLMQGAFEGLLDSFIRGDLSLSNVTKMILREVAMQAKAKAAFEFAEGLAAAANPITAKFAGGHFRAAAAYGAVAIATGIASQAMGGGGSGGGASLGRTETGVNASSDNYTRIAQYVTETGAPMPGYWQRPAPSEAPITIIIQGQDQQVVARYVIDRAQRERDLGGNSFGQARVERIAVQGIAVVTGA